MFKKCAERDGRNHQGTSSALPNYKTPPVIEVVCGVTFKQLAGYRAPHTGLLWEMIREDFPRCEHAPSLPPFNLESENFPLPRIWFISSDDAHVIQLQDTRFLYNWRKRPQVKHYPRYDSVITAFEKNFKVFLGFVADMGWGSPEPEDCELTYINHIPAGEAWTSTLDIPDVLPDLAWRTDEGRFLPGPKSMAWTSVFDLPDSKGQLAVKLKPVIRRVDKQRMLSLEISANGLGTDRSAPGVRDWFDLAHEWIVRAFADVTSKKVQREIWGLSE